MNKYFVNRFGGSKLGEYAALIGVIVGSSSFHRSVLSLYLLAVLIVELVQDFDFGKALKASIGSVVAFLASSVAQALIMFIMVIWFFIDVFLVG